MVWLDAVIAAIAGLFEAGSVLVIVSSFAQKRKSKDIALFVISCVIMGGTAVVYLLGASKFLLFICYGMIILNSLWYYHFSVMDSICFCAAGIVFTGICEMILSVPLRLLTGKSGFGRGVPAIAAVLAFIACCLVRRQGGFLLVKRFEWLKESILYRTGVMLGGVVAAAVVVWGRRMGMDAVGGFYFVAVVLAVVCAAYKISIYYYEWKVRREYFEAYKNMIDMIRNRQHKFMNQLNAVYLLFELYDNYEDLVREQAKELKSLKEYMMPNRLLVLERPLMITHVYQKMCEATDKGIDLQISLSCSMQEVSVPDVFLIEIIGNVLDNAMDEVLMRGKGEVVYLFIFREQGRVCIHICNEHEKIPYDVYKNFFRRGYSSKGENRGLGLPYVKKIVDKYRGSIEIGNEEIQGKNCFCVKVSFSLQK